MPLRAITSLYRELVPPHMEPYILCLVCFLCRAYGKGDGFSTTSRVSIADGSEENGSGDPW
jgi:hypothetical protein